MSWFKYILILPRPRGMKQFAWGLFFMVMAGCVEPFNLSIPVSAINVLVIDGFVNASDGTVEVILSRAVSISSTDSSYAETGAQVTIEDSNGLQYALSEGAAGYYNCKAPILLTNKYKLNVTTEDETQYSSDFVDIQEAPPIDSVYWMPTPYGVALYVDAHDPGSSTHYYRWTFDETWKFRTPYYVYKIWKDNQLVGVPPANNICWKSSSSTDILVYSTTALAQDKVSKFQVNFLPHGIQKLSTKYSINVHQRAITAELYDYWQQIQTKTQNGGSLFSVLPTQVIGNVHSDANSSETVLGYFSASTVTSKRIFIDTLQLPVYLQTLPAYYYCPNDTFPLSNVPFAPDGTLFYNSYSGIGGILGYLSVPLYCMDCRLSEGTLTKPDFWE